MKLPMPTDKLSGCMWLPRIVAKARLLTAGELPPDYEARFCHPTGVDGQFLSFFGLSREIVIRASSMTDGEVARWFATLPSAEAASVEKWNHLAVNLGRPGFPMAERLPVAHSTSYKHLAHLGLDTVFATLEADEKDAQGDAAKAP